MRGVRRGAGLAVATIDCVGSAYHPHGPRRCPSYRVRDAARGDYHLSACECLGWALWNEERGREEPIEIAPGSWDVARDVIG